MTNSIYDTSYVIYKHTNNVNGKSYIGQTIKGMAFRWKSHCKPNKYFSFQYAIQKYGIDNWTHEILYVSFNPDIAHLDEVERTLIKEHNTYTQGYNETKGGGNGLHEFTRGKTYEELYGIEKANQLKQLRSDVMKQTMMDNKHLTLGDNNVGSYAKLGIEGMKAKSAKMSSTRIRLGIAKGQSNNCSAANMSVEDLSSKNTKSALTAHGKTYVMISPEGKEYIVFGTKKKHLKELCLSLGHSIRTVNNYINKGIVPTYIKPQNNSSFTGWEIYTK